jgi:hypothetical protein
LLALLQTDFFDGTGLQLLIPVFFCQLYEQQQCILALSYPHSACAHTPTGLFIPGGPQRIAPHALGHGQ